MQAFMPLLLGAFIADAVWIITLTIKEAIRERVIPWQSFAMAATGYIFTSSVGYNIFIAFGIEGSGDSFWAWSFATFGIIIMRFTGVISNAFKRIQS